MTAHLLVARRPGEAGSAMLEFILVLPFIFIILVLIFDFGQGFLTRHRTLVAAREVGLRYSVALAENGDASFSSTARQVEQDVLRPRNMTANVERRPDGTCPGVSQESANGGFLSRAFEQTSGLIGKVSSSSTYEITVTRPRLTGRLLANRTFRACYAVDSGTWTKRETGGPLDMLKSAFGKLGKLIGSLF